MIEITWKLFSQTGNIEAYLLFKDLENNRHGKKPNPTQVEPINSYEIKM